LSVAEFQRPLVADRLSDGNRRVKVQRIEVRGGMFLERTPFRIAEVPIIRAARGIDDQAIAYLRQP
jgi:hypothetical protein